MSPYPTKDEIWQLASHLGTSDPSPFFERVSPNVVWDVMGTHPAAGHFTSLEAWQKNALGTVQAFLGKPIELKVINACGGGDQEWACIELEADAVCKNGANYPHGMISMPYNQRYAWLLRFDEKGIVVQAKAYLDSALLQKCADANS